MKTPMFIKIKCRGYKIVHGFDNQNTEIEEVVLQKKSVNKIIATSRIQSATEQYIRMTYSHDRIIYWEYEGGLSFIQKALNLK